MIASPSGVRLAIGALPVLLATCVPAAAQGFPPAAVIVTEVLRQPVEGEIRLVGTVRPRRVSLVAAQTDGLVVERRREDGDYVRAGDPIFLLANDRLQAALVEARADVEWRSFEHRQSEALYRTEAASEEEMRAAAYQLARARAKLQDLSDQNDDLVIRAPFSGYLTRSFTEVGQWLNRGGQVVRLISTDTVRVYADVPERHIGSLRVGDAAQVFVAALGGEPLAGRIAVLPPEGYPESHTFPVVVGVDNRAGRLRSHMSAEVGFAAVRADSAILVHKDALVSSPMGQVVYLAVEGKAEMRPVRVGQAHQGYVAVEGDLPAGALAIVRGNERLQPGQDVRVVRKQP